MSQSTGFSLDAISKLKGEAHANIRRHAAEILILSSAICDVDAGIQLSIAERSIDESQGLVDAARRLSTLIESGAGQ